MRHNTELLAEKAIKGDKSAFYSLCELYGKDILYICVKLMGNRADGEDAAQEVFIRMQKHIHKLRDPARFRFWMNTVIRSVCLNMRQGRIKDGGNVPLEQYVDVLLEEQQEFLPQRYTENNDDRDRLMACIDSMSPHYRQAILLYYYEGLSQAEVARVMVTSEEAVSHILRRARGIMRKKLEARNLSSKNMQLNALAVPVLTAALRADAAQPFYQQRAGELLSASGVGVGIGATALAGLATAGATGALKTGLAVAAAAGLLALAGVGLAFAPAFGAAPNIQASPSFSGTEGSGPPPEASMRENGSLEYALPQSGGGATESGQLEPARPAADPQPQPDDGRSPVASSVAQYEQAPSTAQSTTDTPVAQAPGGTSSSAASSAPASSTITEGAPEPTPVSGGLRLAPGNTRLSYGAGVVVQLMSPDGVLVQQTETDSAGEFTFSELMLRNAGQYTLQFSVPSTLGFGFGAQNPAGTLAVELTPGQEPATEPVLYLIDTAAPSVGILLYDAGDVRTRVNPVRAELLAADNVGADVTWSIRKSGAATDLCTGSGNAITAELAALVQTGDYQLTVSARDAAGNETTQTQNFWIA